MPGPTAIDTTEAPAAPSPLWIIALFIALSEVVAGVAAITTDGTTRLIFAIFAVVFPLVVLSSFIWLLLKHPGNLYSPWQYTEQTTIESYVAALRRERRDHTVVLAEAVSQAVATAVSPTETGSKAGQAGDMRARVADVFDEVLQRSSITIDRSGVRPDADPVTLAVSEETTVQELLDSAYFALQPLVPAYSYGTSWVLLDASGEPLPGIPSSRLARMNLKLAEAGVQPGVRLLASSHVGQNQAPVEHDGGIA